MAGPSAEKHGSVFFLSAIAMAYTKSYIGIPEQITLLKNRGMAIPDEGKAAACLSRIGYYRLSGYWYLFRRQATSTTRLDVFEPSTSFDTIIDLYLFDKHLRMHLLDVIERIEIALRVRVCALLGPRGILAHRDPNVFDGNFSRIRKTNGRTEHQDWLGRIDDEFARSKEEFVKYFKQKYPNEYPPCWISCEVWDFGAISRLIAGLSNGDRTALARGFNLPSPEILTTWVRNLNVSRNICAHHSRLWNRPLAIQPRWPSPNVVPDLAHIANNVRAQTRVYAALALIRYMLRSIHPATDWSGRTKALIKTFPNNGLLSISSAGFPPGWESEAIWN